MSDTYIYLEIVKNGRKTHKELKKGIHERKRVEQRPYKCWHENHKWCPILPLPNKEVYETFTHTHTKKIKKCRLSWVRWRRRFGQHRWHKERIASSWGWTWISTVGNTATRVTVLMIAKSLKRYFYIKGFLKKFVASKKTGIEALSIGLGMCHQRRGGMRPRRKKVP